MDQELTRLINNLLPRNVFSDHFFSFFSLHDNWKLIWIILILYFARRFLPKLIISTFAVFVIVEFILKNFFHRIRPLSEAVFHCPGSFSFPSGHAAVAFAAAVVFAAHDKKRAWVYYLLASFVALSRIYLGCHFLLDVVVGGAIGYIIGRITSSKTSS